jgi:MoaA/NifB/PqqE/SkfB family radical SAM enzyme
MLAGKIQLPQPLDGSRPIPLKVNFITNYTCNLHCSYCGTHELPASMMRPAQLIAAVEGLAALGMQQAHFIGGEPFLRKDLPAALAAARRLGAATIVHSNGIFARPLPGEVFESLDVFHTCLNGSRDAHEATRGAATYDRAVASIRLMRSRGVRVHADMIITSQNAEPTELDHVLGLARQLGFRVNLAPVFEHQLVAVRSERIRNLRLPADRVRAAFRHARDQHDPVVMYNSTEYLDAIAAGGVPTFERCWMGIYSVTVDPLGGVSRCYQYVRRPDNPNGFELGWRAAVERVVLTDCVTCRYSNHAEDNYWIAAAAAGGAPRAARSAAGAGA